MKLYVIIPVLSSLVLAACATAPDATMASNQQTTQPTKRVLATGSRIPQDASTADSGVSHNLPAGY